MPYSNDFRVQHIEEFLRVLLRDVTNEQAARAARSLDADDFGGIWQGRVICDAIATAAAAGFPPDHVSVTDVNQVLLDAGELANCDLKSFWLSLVSGEGMNATPPCGRDRLPVLRARIVEDRFRELFHDAFRADYLRDAKLTDLTTHIAEKTGALRAVHARIDGPRHLKAITEGGAA